MPNSPRTLFIIHFSWVSKWHWKTVIVLESWKSSGDLGMRQSINILDMKNSGMIKLELHVSLQKDFVSMLQSQMSTIIKKMSVDNVKKIFLKSDQKHDCGELLNSLPQICYILSLEVSASFWWMISRSKLLDEWQLKEILDVHLMVTGTHSAPEEDCSEKTQRTLSFSDIFFQYWYLFFTILTQWISPKVYSECQLKKLCPTYTQKSNLFLAQEISFL